MAAVLDNAPVAVFVHSVGDRRLLYNCLAQKFFPGTDRPGTACMTLRVFTSPALFAMREKWVNSAEDSGVPSSPEPPHQLSGKLIHWAGQDAYIEYILDIIDKKTEEEILDTFGSISCGLCIYQIEDSGFCQYSTTKPFMTSQLF